VPAEFRFAFEPSYRFAALPFGITDRTARVVLTDTELEARFGPWRVRTPLSNLAGVELTGPYGFLKTAGPAHLSVADRGLTFATNGRQGVCMRFREAVGGIDPLRRIRHPGLTVTVADCAGLRQALQDAAR
jgi:hypothetical protein